MPLGMSWHDYNEALVERGRLLFDLDFASSWKNELDVMNSSKLGRPYEYPNSYISFLSFLKVGFDIPYRMVEGITEALSEYITFIKEVHFTQIRRRMLSLMKGKKPSELVGSTPTFIGLWTSCRPRRNSSTVARCGSKRSGGWVRSASCTGRCWPSDSRRWRVPSQVGNVMVEVQGTNHEVGLTAGEPLS